MNENLKTVSTSIEAIGVRANEYTFVQKSDVFVRFEPLTFR